MNSPNRIGNRRLLPFVAAVPVVVIAAVLFAHGRTRGTAVAQSSHAKTAAASELLVEALDVETQSVRKENALSGQVEPDHIATVSAEVGKRILRRPISQGDRVSKGGLLAELDSEAAVAALSQALAAKDQAVAARRQAESDYRRAVVETDAARQQARAQVDQALAGQRQAKALVQQATAGRQKAQSFTRIQEMRQAEAALSQARTDEKLAKIECDRANWLKREGAVSQQTLDRARATLDGAIAKREAAEQAVSLAREGARQEDIEAATAQVRSAEAQIGTTSAQLEAARAAQRIADTRDVRLATLRRQIDGLKAQEAQADASVRQARILLDKHRIAAPFTGRVLATLVEAGEMVGPGSPVARLGVIDRVKVTFMVPEATRPGLRVGQPLKITADAVPGTTFIGHIATLGYQADPRSRAFPIEVRVENPRERLLPNMVARLQLSVGEEARRVTIPVGAIATDGNASYVFTLRQGRAVRVNVKLGAPEGDRAEILQGLQPGERIAASPSRLTDGAFVRIAAR